MENEEKKLDDIALIVSKNKKKRKKRLILLLLLLFGTGIMLTTSTYAWFTSNETVAVNTITVNIGAQNGIQVSADGTNWKSIIQTTDLTSVHGDTYLTSINQIPYSLEPVSSGLTVTDDGRLEMFYGTVNSNASGNFYLSASESVETESNGITSTGKFVAFDLFIKSDTDTSLYMTPQSRITSDDEIDKGIKNASRVAFVILGHTTASDTVANIQAMGKTDAAGSYVYLWEPNYDFHTENAVSHARDTYEIPLTPGAGNELVPYDGVIAEIPAETVNVKEASFAKYDSYFKKIVPNYYTVVGHSTNYQIFDISTGVTKVRIYMWIEGQDVDCENSASGGNINYELQFTTNAA